METQEAIESTCPGDRPTPPSPDALVSGLWPPDLQENTLQPGTQSARYPGRPPSQTDRPWGLASVGTVKMKGCRGPAPGG